MAKREFDDCVLPLDMNELAQSLATAEIAEHWIDAIRSYAMEQLKRQVAIPGWRLAPTRPTRRWKDEQAVSDVAIQAIGDEAFRHEVLSPAQMEKLAKRKHLSWDKEFAPLVEKVSLGVKLERTDVSDPAKDFPED